MRSVGLLPLLLCFVMIGCTKTEPKAPTTLPPAPPAKKQPIPTVSALFTSAELRPMFERLNSLGGKMTDKQIVDLIRLSKGLKFNQVQQGPMALSVEGEEVDVLVKIEKVGPDHFYVGVTHPKRKVVETIAPTLKKPLKN